MATNGGPDIIQDGLAFAIDAANKKSYPSSGTTWTDLAGNNNGTLTNGPTFDSTNGGSIDFDGTDDYAITDSSVVSGFGALTIEAWCKLDQTNSPMNIIYNSWWPSDRALLWRVQSNAMQFYTYTSSQVGGTTQSFTNTGWNYLIAWYNGTTMKTFVNTVESGTTFSQSGNLATRVTDSDAIGYYGNPIAYYFNGKFSSLKIYNRALTDTEITQNYNALKSRFGL